MNRPTSVRSELQLHLVVNGSAAMPVRAGMRYDAADPYAVEVAFQTGADETSGVVPWTFARSLLMEGMSAAAGEGDVRVWPQVGADGSSICCLSLSSPSGNALFEVPRVELADFLTQTYDAVPSGSEDDHLDVDLGLAVLLRSDR